MPTIHPGLLVFNDWGWDAQEAREFGAQHTTAYARRLLYMICSACKTVDASFGSIQDLFAHYSRERLQASPLCNGKHRCSRRCCGGPALKCARTTH